jgi:twinkle protein
MADSEVLSKGPCSSCGSSDANMTYTDDHTHCFSCGLTVQPKGNTKNRKTERAMKSQGLLEGEYKDLPKRSISIDTCQKFGYKVARDGGEWKHVADYRGADGKRVVAQKVRGENKEFYTLGNFKEVGLFGQHLWPSSGKRVVITEGEIDAMSVAQMQDCKWPVVSLPKGAAAAKKAVADNLEWLLGYTEVILMFDADEPGRNAAAECAPLFPPGQVKVATVAGYKDANEALVDGAGQLIIRAIYDAKEYRPDGILTMADLKERALSPPEIGLSWPWPSLTSLTYGRRRREVYFLGAGTGVGKTDVFTQVMAHIEEHEESPIAAFYLEQGPVETVKRIAGKIAQKRFHIPDAGWKQAELQKTLDIMEKNNRLFLYDSFGATDWDVIKNHIRYLARAKGVQDVFIDHLTALSETGDDERGSLEIITKEMSMIANELDVTIYCISHLATPEGKSHEEGGRVTIRQFKGSRAIGFWAHYMFGLERNQQHEDLEWRTTTTFRILKDRYTGNATGEVFYLGYDRETGMLSERDEPGSNTEHGFGDESDF